MRFIIIAQAMIPYPTILMIYVQFRTDMASVSMQCYLDMSSRQTRVKTDMAEELDQLYTPVSVLKDMSPCRDVLRKWGGGMVGAIGRW